MHMMPVLYAAHPYGVLKLQPGANIADADLFRMLGCFSVGRPLYRGVVSG